MGFPITIICTLQGTSVTQGNATVFTGNKFAVNIKGFLDELNVVEILCFIQTSNFVTKGNNLAKKNST